MRARCVCNRYAVGYCSVSFHDTTGAAIVAAPFIIRPGLSVQQRLARPENIAGAHGDHHIARPDIGP